VAPHPSSILFITLDSCRYDTFEAADAPNLKSVGQLFKAHAPGSFTFSSHSAMFIGFTPGVDEAEAYANPHYARIFRLAGGNSGAEPWVRLSGRNVIDGFRRLGYLTVGTGAAGWFNPALLTSRPLVRPFDKFFYGGDTYYLRKQIDFVMRTIRDETGPLFVFMNIGETHVPYWHEGAPWPLDDGPCKAFRQDDGNDPALCRERQRACVEWIDSQLAPVLDHFKDANAIVCADHGDAWGEDGQWGHGFQHPTVIDVPLLYRLVHRPEVKKEPTGPRPKLMDRILDRAADTMVDIARGMKRKSGVG
jgi:hypothetical protein